MFLDLLSYKLEHILVCAPRHAAGTKGLPTLTFLSLVVLEIEFFPVIFSCDLYMKMSVIWMRHSVMLALWSVAEVDIDRPIGKACVR